MKTESRYLEIYRTLRTEIENTSYPFGSKMPSKRVAAERFSVSVITVEHAYGLLADEGYISPRQRSGFYVTYSEKETFPTASGMKQGQGSHTHMSETDFPFSVYARTMRRVLTEYGDDIFIKSPNNGLERLRLAIARYLARSRGINVSPEQIYIGSGAEYLYGMIIQMLGGTFVCGIENPSYEKIEQVYRANGIGCELLSLGNDGIDSCCLGESRAQVLHITPYRSFPSNVTASVSKKREYLRWAAEREGLIIEDDCESEFTPSMKPEDTVFSMDSFGRVIYVNTFSRTISPAVRIGYMVIPERMLEKLETAIGFYSCTVPTQDQYILAELLDSGDFERHINRVRRKNRKGKNAENV